MVTNWDDHRFFLAIARERTLTAAGKALGVSQPTVSRRLDALEAKLKVRLFDRTQQGYELTAVGLDLFVTVQRVENELVDADRKIYGKNEELAGELRITCTEILFTGYLSPIVCQFLSQHSGIQFNLTCSQSLLSLSRGEADLALRFTRHPTETLIGRRLASAAYCIYAASSKIGDTFSPADRADWPWIGVNDDAFNRLMFGGLTPEIHFKYQADSMAVLQQMVRSGVGVTLLPCYLADQDPTLRRIDPDPVPGVSFDLWILYHPDIRRVSRIRLFADLIADAIGRDLDLFEGHRPLHTRI